MKWTEAQQQTIETRNKNILVSAAAGSGKTAVLVERIKQLILKDKVDIDRFLITTFTNAASAEMKARLEKAIREEMEKSDADKAFLKKQLLLIPRANIGTFHNFALEIMRRYFYLTDLEPGFKIGDEIQMSIMQKEAVDQLFEQRFQDDFEQLKKFLRKYSSDRNENRIKENIISLYGEMRSIPFYMDWAKERTALLASEEPSRELGLITFIEEETLEALKKSQQQYFKAADMLEEAGLKKLYDKAVQDAELVKAVVKKCEEILGGTGEPEKTVMEIFAEFKPIFKPNQMRASKEEKETFETVKNSVSSYRKQARKYIDDAYKKYYQLPVESYDDELRSLYDDVSYLTGLLKEFEEIYRQKKQERNVVDFDDVMHYAIGILQDDIAAAEYRDKFRFIFIDEFQDSNMLQETIVGRIAGEDNLFMVGDVKQSIYKFRLAEPEIFKRKYAEYAAQQSEHSIKIDLNSNFRSKKKVTSAVNNVFDDIMEDYDHNARLHCTIEADEGLDPQLHIICMPEDGDELLEKPQQEAALICELIRENLGREICDVKKGIMRPVEYRDIAVLSRSRNMVGELDRFLNNEGIPAYGENTGGYFETVELQVFINLLKIIDNTMQDIPLISVMRCPVFDFSTRDLASIRIACRDGSYYDAVMSYRENGEDEILRNKITAMTERIDYWKELKNTVSLDELIRILLYDTGYFDYCSGLPAGKQRVYNLRLLVEKAAAFQQNNYSGLYGFLSYVEAMKDSRVSVGEARILSEGENVVRVMTVHKSKGLEFPIVILAGAGRKITYKGSGTAPSMHKDLAVGLPYVNVEEKWHRKSLLQHVIDGRKSREEYEEEIRILYVAMTRAMDRLLITGVIKETDLEKLEDDAAAGRSFLEMVYGPMSEASEHIEVHHAGETARDASGNTQVKRKMIELFAKGRAERDEEQIRRIDERLRFAYPYEKMGKVKSKYSVTELNKREAALTKTVPLMQPAFSMEEKRPDAAQIGTAMHFVMEKIDFSEALAKGRQHIEEVISVLRGDGLLSDAEVETLDIENIEAFFHDEIGKRAAQAAALHKEREFILQKEVDGVPAVVQGIIDCYFEEDDGIVLIDYKNSYVGPGVTEDDLVARYRQQMELYREALEGSDAVCGMKVKAAYLYLFNKKKFVKAL